MPAESSGKTLPVRQSVPAAAPSVTSPSPDIHRPVLDASRAGEGGVASSPTGGCKRWSRRALVGTDQVPLLSPGPHVGLVLMDSLISVDSLS